MKEEKKMSTENKIILVLVMIFICLVIACMSATAAYLTLQENGTKGGMRERVELETTATMTKVEDGGIYDLSPVVDEVMPSIVALTCTTTTTYNYFFGSFDRDTEGSGSGIIFEQNEKELLIMTNNHVVSGAKSIQVTFADGSMTAGEVKGTDGAADLAVVSVKLSDLEDGTREHIRPAKLGESGKQKVGQMVLAIGNALGYGQSLTVGYISAKERTVNVEDREMTLLQTDAAINPGNSGGALINMDGEVIGINSVKYSATAVERIGYAIPMESALPIIEELKGRETVAEEEQGYLGIYYEAVSDEMHQIYQFPYGLGISEVVKGSAAEKAGLYARDIITAVDGHEVPDSDSLQGIMKSHRVGDKVVLTIQRYKRGGYVEMEIPVALGARPQE